MSGGQIIGGVIGGVIGFFVGGPAGAVAGITLGSGIGGFIDAPDTGSAEAGAPEIQLVQMTTAKEGDVIPEVLGTTRLIGNILNYWGSRTVEIKQTQDLGGKGGGGGSVTTVVGYKYYLSWLQGICIGPVDQLLTVYKGEEVVWFGEIDRPESGGQITITLTEYSDDEGNGTTIGDVTFYFGTDDHEINPDFEPGLQDPTLNTPYRNLCYAFFDDCLLGDYNRVSVFKFVVSKKPVLSFNANNTINKYDYNGAHAIWWILEQMIGIPSTLLDEDSFSDVADTLYNEAFGIGITFGLSPMSRLGVAAANDYLTNLLMHIGAITYYDTDGKLKLKLIRKDEDEGDMLSISDDDIIGEPQITRGSWVETVNEIHGIYPQRIEIGVQTLFGSGDNSFGRLGLGDVTDVNEFTFISSENYSMVDGGSSHSVALRTDGTLWVTGYNQFGQLGLGDNTNRTVFEQVGVDSDWAYIACANHTTLAIKTDGTLWGTGYNINGELGLSDNSNRNEFIQIGSDTDWSKVYGGGHQVIVKKTTGILWATGDNANGQLGVGDQIDRNVLTKISNDVYSEVSGGANMTLATKPNGFLYGWGAATGGRLGMGLGNLDVLVPTKIDSNTYSKVESGNWSTTAIRTDGTLWSTGININGELGLGDNTDRGFFEQVGSGTDWSKIFVPYSSAFAIKSSGTLWATGANGNGELGLGDNDDRNTFEQVGTANWRMFGTNSWTGTIGLRA